MEAAIKRYRGVAYVVGVLLLLMTIGMIMKYSPIDEPTLVETVSMIHGAFYVIYLGVSYDLWRRAGWEPKKLLLMALAGVVPVLTFYLERKFVAEAQGISFAEDVKPARG